MCSNVVTCDELFCAMAITWLACVLNVNVDICLHDILT